MSSTFIGIIYSISEKKDKATKYRIDKATVPTREEVEKSYKKDGIILSVYQLKNK